MRIPVSNRLDNLLRTPGKLGADLNIAHSTSRTPEHPAIASNCTEVLYARAIFSLALAAFFVAGLTGSLIRYWMWQGFPAGLNFTNVRHAHSHLMYFSWVTPALMGLIAANLPSLTGRPAPRSLYAAPAAAFVLGLLSYPPFFLWGYTAVEIGSARMPIAVIFSSLNILAWYAFVFKYRKAVREASPCRPLKLWRFALIFLIAASAGAWGRAILTALKIEDEFLAAASVHLFLDLFSNGWAVLGILGLIYASRERLVERRSNWEDPLVLLGLPLSFLLGVPADLVPTDLRTLAGIGGLLLAAGLILHVRLLWPHFRNSFWSGWGIALMFLALTTGMQALAAFTPAARWAEYVGLRVFYLHVLLLGFVSLGLLAGWAEVNRGTRRVRFRLIAIAVITLLLSLLPLTGLWPVQLGGEWRLASAFLFSLGPPLAVAGLLGSLLALPKRVSQ